MAPGTTWLRPISAIAVAAQAPSSEPARKRPLRPSSEPSATSTGPSHVAVHDRRALLRALVQSRKALSEQSRQRRMEDEAAVRGVVMSDHHNRLRAVRIARLGDDVERVAMGERRAAEPQSPAAHFVPDRRCRDRAKGTHREACPARARAPRRHPGERRAAIEQTERPPVAAVGALHLDSAAVPMPLDARSDPVGGPALAL